MDYTPAAQSAICLHLPTRIWNAYLPSHSPAFLTIPAHTWNSYAILPPNTPLPTPNPCKRTRKRKDCAYKPGCGVLDYHSTNHTSVLYKPPCLIQTCRNCLYWYPHLVKTPVVRLYFRSPEGRRRFGVLIAELRVETAVGGSDRAVILDGGEDAIGLDGR